ncbi:hypothetical protein BAE44_0001943 [Dichanthelium oligosanthes]|uniref:Uncharacterized protein n=1 Tax=Dichanthelium oligosanthes TaxID=888268 RepID=A0A1E5WI40_9POAL|nr:hypothetical protein BAE44_0001943 [Dichanthelium oligosanthes]
MKLNPLLTVLSAAAIGFFMGVSFPVQIIPKVFPLSFGDGNCTFGGSNLLGRFSTPFRNNTSTVDGTPFLQSNASSEKIVAPAKPKGAEKLPPNIVVRESDLHLRRLWGVPREDTPTRKYLLVLTVGYSEKITVNATVHKFSENFDVMLFHYDGRTTEWDEFEWSKQAIHVSARKQAKWWYAKRFLHPSIVAPYEYIFIWDQDLGAETFDAEEYIKIVKKHELDISQPGMDITRGAKTYDINEPEEQIGVVDAQYVAHHVGFTLGNPGDDNADGSRAKVRLRASDEFGMFNARMDSADKAQAEALLAPSDAAPRS